VASNLDIRSFNSSIDGRREAYQARLREVGYAPVPRRPGRGPVVVSLASPEGDVALSVFQRGDLNRDGIEDVLVCFEDSPKNGRFHQVQPLLAQKYTANSWPSTSASTTRVAARADLADQSLHLVQSLAELRNERAVRRGRCHIEAGALENFVGIV